MLNRILIIGGGIAGLSIAWKLAKTGAQIVLFERGNLAREASWAAAGMLAAHVEAEPGEDALLPFALEAQKRWPAFAQELSAASGMDAGYRETGTLFVAARRDDVGVLQQRHDYLNARGLGLEWCDGDDLRRAEPFLHPRITRALLSKRDHQADNRLTVQALIAACKKAGVELRENSAVEKVIIKDKRVSGVVVKGETIAADCVVLAAGAWSGGIDGLAEFAPPVFPMKGQVLALQMDAQRPLMRHVVWTPRAYFVPRADGRLIIGATMEDKGFDTQLTGGGVLSLLEEARDVLPGMEELPLMESWVNFRPTTPDDAPIIGGCGAQGLVFATGQHRNGILFTPLLADTIRDYITGGQLPDIARPFSVDRFKH